MLNNANNVHGVYPRVAYPANNRLELKRLKTVILFEVEFVYPTLLFV